ncbi:hypothetical protein RRG08_004162 [Elysia crispata]|uniref:Uncharacterized protein n=1 Tax=Elysia crispata TaxID=231223 RepID=A0AAE1D5Q8_9GAST|nr:hypothetical protein RRG08_004162 [Elysia crispata]
MQLHTSYLPGAFFFFFGRVKKLGGFARTKPPWGPIEARRLPTRNYSDPKLGKALTHIVWTEARCDGGSGDSTDRAAPHSGQGATGLTLAPTPRTSGRGSPRSGQTNGNFQNVIDLSLKCLQRAYREKYEPRELDVNLSQLTSHGSGSGQGHWPCMICTDRVHPGLDSSRQHHHRQFNIPMEATSYCMPYLVTFLRYLAGIRKARKPGEGVRERRPLQVEVEIALRHEE